MKSTLFSLIMLISLTLFGQDFYTIENEILHSKPTKNELIDKGRNLLSEKIAQNDIKKILSYYRYLSQLEDSNTTAFSTQEKQLIAYIVEDYNYILTNTPMKNDSETAIRPFNNNDDLFHQAHSYIIKNKSMIDSQIQVSNLSFELRSFLNLNLEYYSKKSINDSEQKALNGLSNKFTTLFPRSKFNYFVNQYIRNEKIKFPFQFGMDLTAGYSCLTGDLSNYLSNSMGYGFALEGQYKRTMFFWKISGIEGTATADLIGPRFTLPNGNKFSTLDVSLGGGYDILHKDKISLFPYIGVGYNRLIKNRESLSEDILHIYKFSPSINAGIEMECIIGAIFPKWSKRLQQDESLWGVKFRYQTIYTTGFEIKGLIHSFSVGLLLKTNYKKRKYD